MLTLRSSNSADILASVRRMDELEANLLRYRHALAGGHVGVWEADLRTGELSWDPATENLVGLSTGEFLGTREAFYERVHPEDRAHVQQQVLQAIEDDRSYSAEFRVVLKNGSLRWLACAGEVVRDSNGRAERVVGMATDVTSRHEAEEQLRASLQEKEELLKEVHHRVKNNLQIVCSLLHLQAAQLSDPLAQAALRDSQSRVRSMALVHEAIYRSGDLSRIDLARLLNGLCTDLFRAHRIDPARVRSIVQTSGTVIELERAVSWSLLVNELVANALQHAFPNGRAGTVSVEVSTNPLGGHTLAVSDDGVGLPPGLNFRETKTLGLQLVCSLTAQVGGTIDVDHSAGTTFRVTLPSPRPRSLP